MNYSANKLGIITLALLSNAVVCGAQVQPMTQPTYTGRWWSTAAPGERYGFMAGYFDCDRWDRKGPSRYAAISIDAYRARVTEYFLENSSRLAESVPSAMAHTAHRSTEPVSKGGEINHDRHGFYDGVYWLGMYGGGGVKEQLGFVEGYLACTAMLPAVGRASYSRAPDEYRARIGEWYRFDPKTGDTDPTRDKTKIADVLRRFRDNRK
jgi:hypothetical protein